jgi:hypothetical protein
MLIDKKVLKKWKKETKTDSGDQCQAERVKALIEYVERLNKALDTSVGIIEILRDRVLKAEGIK